MKWNYWSCLSIILNLYIIFTEIKSDRPSITIKNIISQPLNPDVLRIDINKIDGTVLYQLKFKRTQGILANSKTPVIKYVDDIKNRERKFYPEYKVMQNIGDFMLYHDIDNKAAAVVFPDKGGLYLMGIVNDTLQLDRFPVNYLKDVIDKQPGQHFDQASSSSIENQDEDTLLKLNNAVQHKDVSYPELLVVLDHNLLTNMSLAQVIRKQLVYWNAVDMLFALMEPQRIYLNIAAFIVPTSEDAFPFLEKVPGANFVDFYDAMDGIESLFYKYRDQITFDYDIIVVMTWHKLCVTPTRANPVINCINGFSEGRPDIVNKFDDEHEIVDSSAILHFDNKISSYTNAAQKIGFMYTGEYTRKKELKKCPGIMEEYYRHGRLLLSWSNCTQRKISDYIQSSKAQGLKNFPEYILNQDKLVTTTEPPKQEKGWLVSLKDWLLEKNETTGDEINDIIMNTASSLSVETTDFIITTKASSPEIIEELPELDNNNDELQQQFTTSEASTAEQMELIITTETNVPEIIEELEPPKKVSELDNNNDELQQQFTTSEASTAEQMELIITTETNVPEIIEEELEPPKKVSELNNINVELQKDFENSKASLDNLETPASLTVDSTLKPSSDNYLDDFKDDINTVSSPSEYDLAESSPENHMMDINANLSVSSYSTATSLPSFLDEHQKNESLSFESIFPEEEEEEETNVLEPVDNYSQLTSEDLLSTTVESLIENHHVKQYDDVFGDVTVSNEESTDNVADDYRIIPENELVESTDLNRQNQSDVSVVNPVVEESYEATPETQENSHGNQSNYEQNDQATLPNMQGMTEAFDTVASTLQPYEQSSILSILASEDQARYFLRNKRTRSTQKSQLEEGTSDDLNNNNVTQDLNIDQYSNQIDSAVESNTEQYSNQHDSVLSENSSRTSAPLISISNRFSEVNDNSIEFGQDISTTVDESTSTVLANVSSTSSPLESSCENKKVDLNVSLQLNINTNGKGIKTLKRLFHNGLLNQDNENATDTNDNKIVERFIEYLMKRSNR